MKKFELYGLVAAMIIPGVLCAANYIYSLTSMDPHAAFHRRQYRDAIRVFRYILRDKPDDTESRVCLALTLEAAGMPRKAVEEYKEAVLRAPDGLIAGLLAADLMGRYSTISAAGRDEWNEIEGPFRQAMQARGASQELASYGPTDRVTREEVAESRAALGQVLKEDPSDLASHIGLGFAHWLSSRPDRADSDAAATDRAIAEFRKSLLIAPDDPLANYGLIMAERQATEIELRVKAGGSKHFAAMDQALRDAVRRLPASPVPIAGLVGSHYSPAVYRSSVPQIEGWVKRHPRSALTNFVLAWLYATNSRHVAAADPVWDHRSGKPLKLARALAPRWKTASDLQAVVTDARKRSRLILQSGACIPGLVEREQALRQKSASP